MVHEARRAGMAASAVHPCELKGGQPGRGEAEPREGGSTFPGTSSSSAGKGPGHNPVPLHP